MAVAGLVAGTLLTASAAQAKVWAQPSSDPKANAESEIQELQRQISELHDSWDALTPDQRNQRINQLQLQVTTVDKDIKKLPEDQQAEVQAPLVPSALELADLLGKAQASAPQPCVIFFGPPPCGI
jgi:peptidoglycan hydrolase CwlO-like protein